LKEREKNYENRGGDSSFIHQMLELFDGRLIETGAKKLGSRDFWTFSLEELDCEPQEEEDEVPF
jgi:hypothetical protein